MAGEFGQIAIEGFKTGLNIRRNVEETVQLIRKREQEEQADALWKEAMEQVDAAAQTAAITNAKREKMQRQAEAQQPIDDADLKEVEGEVRDNAFNMLKLQQEVTMRINKSGNPIAMERAHKYLGDVLSNAAHLDELRLKGQALADAKSEGAANRKNTLEQEGMRQSGETERTGMQIESTEGIQYANRQSEERMNASRVSAQRDIAQDEGDIKSRALTQGAYQFEMNRGDTKEENSARRSHETGMQQSRLDQERDLEQGRQGLTSRGMDINEKQFGETQARLYTEMEKNDRLARLKIISDEERDKRNIELQERVEASRHDIAVKGLSLEARKHIDSLSQFDEELKLREREGGLNRAAQAREGALGRRSSERMQGRALGVQVGEGAKDRAASRYKTDTDAGLETRRLDLLDRNSKADALTSAVNALANNAPHKLVEEMLSKFDLPLPDLAAELGNVSEQTGQEISEIDRRIKAEQTDIEKGRGDADMLQLLQARRESLRKTDRKIIKAKLRYEGIEKEEEIKRRKKAWQVHEAKRRKAAGEGGAADYPENYVEDPKQDVRGVDAFVPQLSPEEEAEY